MHPLSATLDRWNARHPWSHNAAYSWFVVAHARALRRRGGSSVLDVGCGAGLLLARLRRVLPDAAGVEPDPRMARLAARSGARITAELPAEPVDLVVLVASLHHLDADDALPRLRALVRPGGRLVAIAPTRSTWGDLPREVFSLVANPIVGFVRHPLGTDRVPEHMTAPTVSPVLSHRELRLSVRRHLPDARMFPGLFWRSVVVWEAP